MGQWKLFAAAVLGCLLAFSAGAQTVTANITGTVTDASGAVVTNVKVTATNIATNGGNVTLSNNRVSAVNGLGGAVYVTGGALNIGGAGSTVTIQNNSAGYDSGGNPTTGTAAANGGALYTATAATGTTTITGDTITLSGNKALLNGGVPGVDQAAQCPLRLHRPDGARVGFCAVLIVPEQVR